MPKKPYFANEFLKSSRMCESPMSARGNDIGIDYDNDALFSDGNENSSRMYATPVTKSAASQLMAVARGNATRHNSDLDDVGQPKRKSKRGKVPSHKGLNYVEENARKLAKVVAKNVMENYNEPTHGEPSPLMGPNKSDMTSEDNDLESAGAGDESDDDIMDIQDLPKKNNEGAKADVDKEKADWKEHIDRSSWERVYVADKDEYGCVSLEHIRGAKLHSQYAVMWNTDESDINNIRNFLPAYLKKVTKDAFEVMDDSDEVCFATLTVEGDEGISNMWGTYIKPPTDEFMDHCKVNNTFSDGAHSKFAKSDIVAHKVTPRRKAARDLAARNMEKSANKVYNRVKSESGNVKVGDVV